ncbi:MAG: mechanosensitive ion channel family protein, partial [candidate division Zixibacteria bacterium]|nr:mechanosensitive ion channel family protein [candidate division Zixibacteria bacterium]
MYELLEKLPLPPLLQMAAGIVAIILLTILFATMARLILSLIADRIARRTRTDLDDRLLAGIKRRVPYLVFVIGAVALFNYLEHISEGAAPALFRTIDGALFVVGVYIVTVMIVGVISTLLSWYTENIASRTETTLDDEFVPLADRVIKIIAYILALLIILDHFNVDIMGLVAVLGIGSLAIALAAQETIANMIGGFVIMIDRPFRVGDRVRLGDGTTSVVDQIGIRSTKFRTFDNTLIIVPNAELIKSTVHNLTYPHPRLRVQIDVGVGYDSDIDQVRQVMLGEANNHSIVLADPKPSWYFLEFGDSSLNVSLRCWVADPSERFRTASELREEILSRFREEGIEIPFPQRVVTMVPKTSSEEKPQRRADRGEARRPGHAPGG